jgi:hypothetical protein
MSRIQVKDPNDVDDFGWDFTDLLATGETIATEQIIAPVGVTVGAITEVAGVVTARLSGGTLGVEYQVACRVTTSAGKTLDRTLRLFIRDL